MCAGENLLLTFLKTVSLSRKIFAKLWAVYLYLVSERENRTEKNPEFFSFLLQNKDQIKCFFEIQTTFSLLQKINQATKTETKQLLSDCRCNFSLIIPVL